MSKISKKRLVIIFLIILLLFSGVGLAWYVIYGGKVDSVHNSQPTTQPDTKQLATKDLVSIIEATATMSNFSKLINASGVKFTLQTVGSKYLVLAPNNEGFKSLPDGYFNSLLTTEKQTVAQSISKYHIALLPATDLVDKQKLKTLNGQEVIIGLKNGKYSFTDAKGNVASAIGKAQKATNGQIFTINNILLPQ